MITDDVHAELSALVGCGSPDGRAELGQVEMLLTENRLQSFPAALKCKAEYEAAQVRIAELTEERDTARKGLFHRITGWDKDGQTPIQILDELQVERNRADAAEIAVDLLKRLPDIVAAQDRAEARYKALEAAARNMAQRFQETIPGDDAIDEAKAQRDWIKAAQLATESGIKQSVVAYINRALASTGDPT